MEDEKEKDRSSRAARTLRQRKRAVKNVLVDGFPEICARHPQCRICALIDTDPELLRQIHQLARNADIRPKRLSMMVADKWPEGDVPDHQCFARHFKGHCDFGMSDFDLSLDDELLPELPLLETEKARPSAAVIQMPPPAQQAPLAQVMTFTPRNSATAAPPGIGMLPGHTVAPPPRTAAARQVAMGEDNSDYFELGDLITRLKKRVHEMDERAQFYDDEGKVDGYAMNVWTKLSSELVHALEVLNRMRNSDRLMQSALQAHTKRFVQGMSDPLLTRLESVLDLMEPRSKAAVELRLVIDTDAKGIILRTAKQTLAESYREFKLN